VDGATRAFIEARRRAVLATIDDDGRARLLPICFALAAEPPADAAPMPPTPVALYSPLDEKPKRVRDVRRLARVRDIEARPDVTLLFDHWSEDWSALGWVRIQGVATLLEPGGRDADEHAAAIPLLRARYPQYAAHALERAPLIRVSLGAARPWGAIG
jgi:PPOX class probable F420-dependent enzyme